MIHLDVDFSRVVVQDVAHKYVDAKAGSLVGAYRTKNWTFAGVIGEKTIYIIQPGSPAFNATGLIASGAVSYVASSRLTLTCALGRDIGSSWSVPFVPDYQTVLRVDALIHLF